jgi:hypothetical protein
MYFDRLCAAASGKRKKIVARRIIILPDEDQGDLRDPVVMESFWNATGKSVRSYFMIESALKQALPTVFRLEDAALHDNELFLQYDRDHGIVQFHSLKARPAPANPRQINTAQELVQFLFSDLDLYLNNRKGDNLPRFQYVEVTSDFIKQMTGKEVAS